MLHGNESISHYTPSNIAVWMSMAFQAGLLNIGGFMACHRLVSHVTGFATFFGFEFSEGRYWTALGMLAVPFFFLFGAMLSGQLVDIQLKRHKKPRYYISFGIIFFFILVVLFGGMAGKFGSFGEPLEQARDYLLLAMLCLVCGIQNGTITSASKAIVRTTHLTGITTDLGLGIVRVLNRKNLDVHMDEEIQANFMRAGIIFFFGLGSILGGIVFHRYEYTGFIIPAITSGLLFFITLYFQLFHMKRR